MHHWCAPDLKYIRQVRALQFDSSWRKGQGEREREKGKQGKKDKKRRKDESVDEKRLMVGRRCLEM